MYSYVLVIFFITHLGYDHSVYRGITEDIKWDMPKEIRTYVS